MGVLPDWMIERDVKISPMADGIHRPGVISYGTTSYGYDARVGYKFKIFSQWYGAMEIDPKNFDPKVLIETDVSPVKHCYVKSSTGAKGGCGEFYCSLCGHEVDTPDQEVLCEPRFQPRNYVHIPAHSFALAETVEEFTIPRDCLCVVVGKSTYARTGLIVNVTPGEPDWIGRWTVELSNTTPLPIKVYAGEGIMQCLFFRSDGYGEAAAYALHHLFTSNDLIMPVWFKEKMMLKLQDHLTCDRSYADKKGKYQGQTGITNPIVEGTK